MCACTGTCITALQKYDNEHNINYNLKAYRNLTKTIEKCKNLLLKRGLKTSAISPKVTAISLSWANV